MERNLLFSLSIVLTGPTFAQLAPQQDAPLKQHLLEVNRCWSVMDPSPVGGDRIVHFNSEAERIATHLHMVRERLAAANTSLSANAAHARNAALSELDAYADRGVFPQNHVLPVRNPVFIDPQGTACAVGQLMIASGNRHLAQRIHDEMNLAYVHDMHRQDVTDWAVDHGFTEDELAWIQPGYPPNYDWYGLGDGTNGPVYELLHLSNGDLVVAGDFTLAGNVPCTRVAKWNGSNYQAMGALPAGLITSSIEFNGEVYIGGSFNSATNDLMRWNGSSWVASTVFASNTALITALHEHNGSLYAAGATTGFAGTSYSLRKLMNGTWVDVGQQLNGTIHSIETFGAALVCGGEFFGNFLSQDTTLRHVATLSGNTWEQLANGLNGSVYDLLVDQGQLYAGGDCMGEIVVRFGMARIASGAITWEQLMPNIVTYMDSPLDALVHISSLKAINGGIYFGGDFGLFSGLTSGFGLGLLNGPDAITVMANFNAGVNDLDIVNDTTLVCGGLFSANSGLSVPYIATQDLSTGITSPSVERGQLAVWPDPATDHVNIALAQRALMNVTVDILDANGRTCRSQQSITNGRLDISTLPAGMYVLRLNDRGQLRTASFVKH